MISKTLVLGLALVLIFGCAGQEVTPAATLSGSQAPTVVATPRPTATPAPAPTTAENAAWDTAQTAFDAYLNADGSSGALYNGLGRAAVRLLREQIDATKEVSTETLVRALDELRQALQLPDTIKPRVLVIPVQGNRGERTELVCFSLVGMQGMPVVMLLRRGASLQVLPDGILGAFDTDGKRWAFLTDLAAVDTTGDGMPELVYNYVHPGGSNSRGELEILHWDSGKTAFRHIFHGFLVSWVGESVYSFVPNTQGNDLKLSYPWFGTFSVKMMDHLRAEEVWRYDATTQQMVRQTYTLEPPRSVRHQVNIAEVLYRDGDLEGALTAFTRAATDETLIEERFDDVVHAARAFASFRRGQVLALLGREREAREAFRQPQSAGGTLGALVNAYLRNYQGDEAALRAWAHLPREIDLQEEIRLGEGGSNIDLPAAASDILFQGGIVAAYLNEHAVPDTELQAHLPKLYALGFQGHDAQVLDWDGDGQNEILVIIPDGIGDSAVEAVWLIFRKGNTWRARALWYEYDAHHVQVLEPLGLPAGKGKAISIVWMRQKRYEERWAWDGSQLLQLNLATLEPLAVERNYKVVGTLPEQIDF